VNDVSEIVRAVIADDEPIARAALRGLIKRTDWIECVGEASDGIEALEMVGALQPELLFLDIRMPGTTGVEVLERVGATTPVIFTTAYNDYALTAFELGAIDYLQKPFGEERFLRAVSRARPYVEAIRRDGQMRVGATIRERVAFARSIPQPLDRLFAREGPRVIPIKVEHVSRFEADGDYVAILTGGKRYLIYVNIGDLAERLDGGRFIRIHRSHIINLDSVAAIAPYDATRMEVRMSDGARVIASRTGSRLLRERCK
jgi:two-component system LytT family response regulator